MRIRSVKPEFWRSDDIAALPWNTRLVFIGLWSYVDDNGVGRDDERLIRADLFALDDDLTEASVRVHDALQQLSDRGLILRYTVGERRFLHIVNWAKHQKINRPSPGRLPPPTSDGLEPHDLLTEGSVNTQNSGGAGTEDQGAEDQGAEDQGAEDQGAVTRPSPSRALAVVDTSSSAFDEFWDAYPRKVAKGQARTAFTKACRQVSAETVVEAAHRLRADPNLPVEQFIPHPATWLNGERWGDGPLAPLRAEPRPENRGGHYEIKAKGWMAQNLPAPRSTDDGHAGRKEIGR